MGRRGSLLALGTACGALAPRASARVLPVSFAYDVSVQRCQETQGEPRSRDLVSSGRRVVRADVDTVDAVDASTVAFEEEFDFGDTPVRADAVVRGTLARVRGKGVCLEGFEANLRDLAVDPATPPVVSRGAIVPEAGSAPPPVPSIAATLVRVCVPDADGVVPVFVSGSFRLDDSNGTVLGVTVVGELARI